VRRVHLVLVDLSRDLNWGEARATHSAPSTVVSDGALPRRPAKVSPDRPGRRAPHGAARAPGKPGDCVEAWVPAARDRTRFPVASYLRSGGGFPPWRWAFSTTPVRRTTRWRCSSKVPRIPRIPVPSVKPEQYLPRAACVYRSRCPAAAPQRRSAAREGRVRRQTRGRRLRPSSAGRDRRCVRGSRPTCASHQLWPALLGEESTCRWRPTRSAFAHGPRNRRAVLVRDGGDLGRRCLTSTEMAALEPCSASAPPARQSSRKTEREFQGAGQSERPNRSLRE